MKRKGLLKKPSELRAKQLSVLSVGVAGWLLSVLWQTRLGGGRAEQHHRQRHRGGGSGHRHGGAGLPPGAVGHRRILPRESTLKTDSLPDFTLFSIEQTL